MSNFSQKQITEEKSIPTKFVKVLLPLALPKALIYATKDNISIGNIVNVELGKKKIFGLVVDEEIKAPDDFDVKKIKKIISVSSDFSFSKKQILFLEKIASYNLANQGLVLRSFIGTINSNKTKKAPKSLTQEVDPEKFLLKKLDIDQQKIFDEISQLIKKEISATCLINGTTGSGKTEIYFSLIAEILRKNDAQILILLPEIALTSQLLIRFEEQFAFKPALWHSKISQKNKREIFLGIVNGKCKILVGARSALLLPFKNLCLIVVDEEHDSSFKQEDVFNFHARDMAILKSKIENFPVILSSATPSIESYANAIFKKYHHFLLDKKFNNQRNLVSLIDLNKNKNDGLFLSRELREEIIKNFHQKKQGLLFLNRRGYASASLCKTCGKKYECKNCDSYLVLHKVKKKLICHHCGYEETNIDSCKFCAEKNSLISFGVGVEKIAEEIKNLLPEARIALVTSDEITNFLDAERMVKKILSNEVDIIIGTQMIAKGYDFPNLSLVAIIDADSMLYSSELKALEKAYQLFTQVIGRAGRRNFAGKTFIQTYYPENLILQQIIRGNQKEFYRFEMNNRKAMEMPPFSKIAKFEISAFNESEAKNFAKNFVRKFPFDEKIELFGPAPAVLQKLRNRHHFLVNLKVKKTVNLQKLIEDILTKITVPKSIRIRVDIDPC
jgi:primosomal protein N' (replication factor Y)